MAFSSVGSLGTASLKTAGTSLAMNPSRAVAAGQIVVVWVAWDSVYSIFAPSDGRERIACYDDAGNVYCTIGGISDSRDFFDVNAQSVLFVSQLKNALATTDEIFLLGDANARTAKAMSAWEFNIGAGKRWANTSEKWVAQVGEAVDPASISLTPGPSQEYLFLHLLATEGPDTDTYTWDADYTEIDGDGTTGGADDSNVHIRGGWRIVTAASDTVNVSSDTADRDHTQVLAAICEVDPLPFPRSGILDTFNRADEEPLDNGTWDTSSGAGPSSPGSPRFMRVLSNQCAAGTVSAPPGGGQFWDTEFESCVEVYVTIADYDGGNQDVHLHAAGDSSTVTMSGHGLAWDTGLAGGQQVAPHLRHGLSGNGGGVHAENWKAWLTPADGYGFGLQRTQALFGGTGVEHAFVDRGGGWEEIGATYLNAGGGHRTNGKIAAAVWNGTTRLDDFGGGPVSCFASAFVPQIYRRPHRRGG